MYYNNNLDYSAKTFSIFLFTIYNICKIIYLIIYSDI